MLTPLKAVVVVFVIFVLAVIGGFIGILMALWGLA